MADSNFLALSPDSEYFSGETTDSARLLIFEQKNFRDEPTLAELKRVANPAASNDADKPGWYKHQLGLNPDSDIGIRQNFIENPILTANLTAKAGKPGRQNILGTLNLPLAYPMAPFARNILQSRNTTDGTITASTPHGAIAPLVVAAATAIANTTLSIASANNLSAYANIGTRPAQLEIDLVQDIADVAAGTQAQIVIVGIDHWNNELRESFLIDPIAANDTNVKLTSQYYWKQINTIERSGFATGATGTMSATARDDSVEVSFKPYDAAMLSYLLINYDLGRIPTFFRGAYAASAQIVVEGEDALAELRFGIGGRKGYELERPTPDYKMVSGNPLYDGETGYGAATGTVIPQKVPVFDNAWTDDQKAAFSTTDYRTRQPSEVEIITDPVMETNRVEVQIGGVKLPIADVTIDFGLQFDPPPFLTTPEENPPPIRRFRQPIVSGRYQTSLADRIGIASLSGIKANYLDVVFNERGLGAFPGWHKIRNTKTQIQEANTPSATAGATYRSFSMLGLPSKAGVAVSDDIVWTMFVPYYQAVRNY